MSDIFSATDPALARLASKDIAMLHAKEGLTQKKLSEIDAAAKDFEAMFISEMLGNMFESVGVDPMFGGGNAEETWRSMMVEEYGKQLASTGGIGLSADIKAKMIEMQGEMNQ